MQQLGLSEAVRLIGYVEGTAKREFFDNADVLIMPSYTENFGLVAAEALAHGVPVIASRGTPWSRVAEIGCGLWVANDSESLADAMRQISSMSLCEMGLRGREWMQREFAWDALAEKMAHIYHNLLLVDA